MGLVLSPTRELSEQVYQVLDKLGQARGVKTCLIVGIILGGILVLVLCCTGGGYFMMNMGDRHKAVCEAFAKEGVRLRDQSSKNHLQGWVRVTLANKQTSERFLTLLDKVLS